ncbi:TPA: hypothetical protein LA742_002298 [Clostridium botulinum]|uniref:hypothetical protein n=1 Tax=Clostridium TaxID=1485 RepID=UPI000773008E|nr:MULTISPECIES: hypothetical protein [Clostridium]AUM96494.1 hypothetical protein RSJ11_15590 [Clostridium sporogenes]AVQ53945.1 hypothetical protein C7M59_14195 [Clostridium botulinum]HBJ2613823.1 hypothetical protein [Clostridium botulinum]
MGQYKESIKEFFFIINKILKIIYIKQKNNEIDEQFMKCINYLADVFLHTVNLLNKYELPHKDIEILIEEISNDLVYVIELINKNIASEDIELLISNINDKFNMLKDLLNKILKYKILIYGVNDISIQLKELINYDNSDLIFYISNNSEHFYKYIDDIFILPLDEAIKSNYDYIIIADTDLNNLNRALSNNKVSKEQIFNYMYYICNFGFYSSPEFFTQYNSFMKNNKRYDGIITGISYTQKGINAELLPGRFFNFACASQDLYYDYEMMKYSLSFEEVRKTIKYAIIGLCYYSFQYDLSKGVGKRRSNYYYRITGKYHNYDLAQENKNFYKNFCEISKKIFKSNSSNILYEIEKEEYIKIIRDSKNKKFDSSLLNNEEKDKYIKNVKREFNKSYLLTVEENKEIFKSYLDMLYENNIEPIVVVPPETEIYRDNISIPIRNEFYEIIEEYQEKYSFQFLDYFYSNDFTNSDFYDGSHLNNKGSEKWTKLLGRDIKW